MAPHNSDLETIDLETTVDNSHETMGTTDRKRKKTMKPLLKNSGMLLLASCLAVACMKQTVYHSYQPIPNEGWNKSDTLIFQIPITDSLPATLQLATEVRNSTMYPYQNLFVIVSHNLQDSLTFQTDTLEFVLADKEGNWKGSGWGSLLQSTLPLGKVKVKGAGNYILKMSHGMKDETLEGIRDAGLSLTR